MFLNYNNNNISYVHNRKYCFHLADLYKQKGNNETFIICNTNICVLMVALTDLPNEILTIIAEQFDVEEYKHFSLVCKHTAQIAKTVEKKIQVKSLRIKYGSKYADLFCAEYLALPNGDLLETPKFTFPVKREVHQYYSETHIPLETQLSNLLLCGTAPENSEQLKQINAFLMFYIKYLAPVELLWATWNYLEYQKMEPIRFSEFVEFWINKNYNLEWNGCLGSSAPYQLLYTKNTDCIILSPDLIHKEIKRINNKYAEICAEGATRINAALKALKEKQKLVKEPIYRPGPAAPSQKTLLDFSTEEIVRQIVLLDHFNAEGALPCELHAIVECHSKDERTSPHIYPIIRRANSIAGRLTLIILQAETRELRSLLVQKLREVALHALHQCKVVDYNLVYSLLNGLQYACIFRLRLTRSLASSLSPCALTAAYEEMVELFSSDRMYHNIRKHIASQKIPFLPPLSVSLSDFYFHVDGHFGWSIRRGVECRKMLNVAEAFTSFYGPVPSCKAAINQLLAENNNNWEFSDWFFDADCKYDEQETFKRTLEIEPRSQEAHTLTCGASTNPILSYPVENVLLAKNEQEELLIAMLNPFTTSLEHMLLAADNSSATVLIPFLVSNFYHLESREITENENEYPDFRLNIVISIQYRILLILWSIKDRITGSPFHELVNQLMDSTCHVSPFYSLCQRFKAGDKMSI